MVIAANLEELRQTLTSEFEIKLGILKGSTRSQNKINQVQVITTCFADLHVMRQWPRGSRLDSLRYVWTVQAVDNRCTNSTAACWPELMDIRLAKH
jgi:hypothetical protein